MLTVNQLTKRFGDVLLFENVSFTVNNGERVGLIGPNGCGKTTILRIVAGEDVPSRGSVMFSPSDVRLGYLPQGMDPQPQTPVRDVLYPQVQAMRDLEDGLAHLGGLLADHPDDREIQDAYARTLEQLTALDNTYQPENSAAILAGLDLDHLGLDDAVGILSGGQKTRLGLARLLMNAPQVLLLDEPTNHLDITALEWLEEWLAAYSGAILIVSHDRTFLDRTVNRIVALAPVTRTAQGYPGNYTDYVEAVVKARDKQWGQYRDQVVEVERRKRDIQRTMARAVRKENATKNDQQRRYAKKVAKKAKSKEKHLERYIDAEDRVTKPQQSWQMKLDFGNVEAGSREVLRLDGLAVGYDRAAPLLTDINLTIHVGERVALLGPNGAGKTTLLRSIMGELPPLAGSSKFGTSTVPGYLSQEQDVLTGHENALAAVLAEVGGSETEARTFLHNFLFSGDEVFVPTESLSYGQRARLMLALLVARGCNLLILDEPVNHLDVPSRERFEQAMASYAGTVLAVVHDRYFVDRFASRLWVAEAGAVRVYLNRAEYQKVRNHANS